MLSLTLFLASFATAHATVVRMEIAFGDDPNTEDIYIELLDTVADVTDPACPDGAILNHTVDNFLRYVENAGERRYDGSFIHRSVPGVVQGGGFSFRTSPTNGVVPIQTDDPICNQFSTTRPNVRGTIAMAKTAISPDTATSQWFFNQADNNINPDPEINFDTQNGGFTVFGNVIGNGMLVVDRIAALSTVSLPLPPVGNRSQIPFTRPADFVDNAILVVLPRVEVFTVPETPRLSLSQKYQIDFGDLGPGLSQDLEFSVANLGNSALNFSLQFTGPDAASFSATNDCTDVAFGESCTETLTFLPASVGQLDAQLEITSNDPDSLSVLVPVDAFASGDNDGIPDDIEAAGPNNGDANNDGTPDILQDHVTSFPNENDQYVSLETSPGLEFTQVQAIDNPSPSNTPRSAGAGTTLDFGQGFYAFNIENVGIGGTATVTMTLPPGSNQNAYFKYGLEEPGQIFQRWYLFDFDGTTGAQFQGNQVILHYVDGGRGDDDGEANGVIVDPGGPAALNQDGGASGGGCSALPVAAGQLRFPVDFILLLSGLFVLRRYRTH